ncbi:unnamed protein product [Rotaria sp. Silwood1]|nr:unnamed protein product [Rotaria sp. Silwood1]
MEPEMAYYDIDDDMDLIEDFLEYVVQRVIVNCKTELEILERDVTKLEKVKKPFPRITYDEAVEILRKKDIALIRKTDHGEEHIRPFPWGEDFGAPHEEAIVEDYDKPVLVHRWPAEAKAFYMKRDPENPKICLGVDVLAPEGFGEIIGGSQREDNLDLLLERIEEHKLPVEVFDWEAIAKKIFIGFFAISTLIILGFIAFVNFDSVEGIVTMSGAEGYLQ